MSPFGKKEYFALILKHLPKDVATNIAQDHAQKLVILQLLVTKTRMCVLYVRKLHTNTKPILELKEF